MKALLIDPVARTLTEIQLNPEDPTDPRQAILDQLKCERLDIVSLLPGEDLFVDHDGLAVKPNPHGYFALNGWAFAGRGVVLGYDEQIGGARDTTLTVETLQSHLEWVDPSEAPESETLVY